MDVGNHYECNKRTLWFTACRIEQRYVLSQCLSFSWNRGFSYTLNGKYAQMITHKTQLQRDGVFSHKRASGFPMVSGCSVELGPSYTARVESAMSLSSISSAAEASILLLEKSLMSKPSTIFQDLSCGNGNKIYDYIKYPSLSLGNVNRYPAIGSPSPWPLSEHSITYIIQHS